MGLCNEKAQSWEEAARATGQIKQFDAHTSETFTYVGADKPHSAMGEEFKKVCVFKLPSKKHWGFKLKALDSGALVLFSCDPGETGYACGVRNGDVLTQVGDEVIDVETASQALTVITNKKMATTKHLVIIKVYRMLIDVLLPANLPWGFTLEELSDHTLQVISADNGEYGFKGGVRNCDCLMQVGNETLKPNCSAKSALKIINRHKLEDSTKEVKIRLRRPAAIIKNGSIVFRENLQKMKEKEIPKKVPDADGTMI